MSVRTGARSRPSVSTTARCQGSVTGPNRRAHAAVAWPTVSSATVSGADARDGNGASLLSSSLTHRAAWHQSRSAFAWDRRSQSRTVVCGWPTRSATRRCPRPFDAVSSASRTVLELSARQGHVAPEARTWVCLQERHRARWGVMRSWWSGACRTVRSRAEPHGASWPRQSGDGQRRRPEVSLACAVGRSTKKSTETHPGSVGAGRDPREGEFVLHPAALRTDRASGSHPGCRRPRSGRRHREHVFVLRQRDANSPARPHPARRSTRLGAGQPARRVAHTGHGQRAHGRDDHRAPGRTAGASS